MKIKHSKLLSIFGLCLFVSCGSGHTNTDLNLSDGVQAKASIVMRALQVPVSAINYSVEASDMQTIGGTINNPPFDANDPTQITLTIPDIPVGIDRLFKLEVFTDQPGKVFRGEATSDVTQDGVNVPMNLRFANFILDFQGDSLSAAEAGIIIGTTAIPDITGVSFRQSVVDTTKIEIEITFDGALNQTHFGPKFILNRAQLLLMKVFSQQMPIAFF